MRDIATAAGVHFSTVSLALRNHPRLPKATCERVQKVAAQLGYVPDPMLASLASYRRILRPVSYRATLAWVSAFPGRDDWRNVQIFRKQHAGAQQRAEEIGYKLEHFWLGEPGLSPARASQILRTRSITGLIMAPLPRAGGVLKLDWADFSTVAIGYSLVSPGLHVVSAHQYRCIRLAVQELRGRGYGRIGLVMLVASDDRVDNNWLAGLLIEQHGMSSGERLLPLLMTKWDEREFAAWMNEARPDAIITKLGQVVPVLHAMGLRPPEGLGLVYLGDAHPGEGHSGVDENPQQVGAAAVDFVVGMLHRNERGVPAVPHRLLIDGIWIEGTTVRPRPAGAVAAAETPSCP